MTPTVRLARPDDLAVISEIRVRTWQRAYRGIMPQPYLDGLRPETVAARWRGRLDLPPGDPHRDYLAELGGQPVGWAATGPYRDDDCPAPQPGCGEIYAIYIRPEHWRGGIGRVLVERVLADLTTAGLTPVLLWVLADNTPAREFYQRVGFDTDGGEHFFEVGGARLAEVRYRNG
jgi:GNAT superfamily N-acetyltransferase